MSSLKFAWEMIMIHARNSNFFQNKKHHNKTYKQNINLSDKTK